MPDKTIKFASDLLCRSPEVLEIPVEEFARKVSEREKAPFEWNEAVTSGGVEVAVDMPGFNPDIARKLVVCNMGDSSGFGVFSAEPIKANTIIARFSGDLSDAYEKSDLFSFPAGKKFITANKKSNWSRFIKHLPELSSMKHYVAEVAYANLKVIIARDSTVWFCTSRDIESNELLGFDYTKQRPNYWVDQKIIPEEFDKFGCVLPFSGIIYIAHIVTILIYTAIILEDSTKLYQLEYEYPDLYASVNKRIKDLAPDEVQHLFFCTIVFSHIDLLFLFRPEDRLDILKVFKKGIMKNPEDYLCDKPYSQRTISIFLKWRPPHSSALFVSNLSEAVLEFPEGFFDIINPLRFHVYHLHKNQKDLNVQIDNYTNAGHKSYTRGNYKDAINSWQLALSLEMDCIMRFGSKKDSKYLNLHWNLGNAYHKASIGIEGSTRKRDYLFDAMLCIGTAIHLIKDSHEASNKEKIPQYQERLDLVGAEYERINALFLADKAGAAADTEIAAFAGAGV